MLLCMAMLLVQNSSLKMLELGPHSSTAQCTVEKSRQINYLVNSLVKPLLSFHEISAKKV